MFSPYIFRLALSSLYKEKWINLLTTLTIAVGLSLIALSFSILYNIELATGKLPDRFTIMVFLKDDLAQEDIAKVIQAIKEKDSVKGLKYISKDDAVKELKTIMKDVDSVIQGLGDNPLPPSIEISLKKESVGEASVKGLADELRKIDGVNEVYYGEKFLSSIQTLKSGVEGIGMLIMGALSAGIIFVCYSTVKVLFYRRKDEIETIQLLGATRWFIRAPFIIESCLIGMAGGLIAGGVILLLKYLISFNLSLNIPLLKAFVFPTEAIIYTPLTGVLIGLIGGMIAIGRLRF